MPPRGTVGEPRRTPRTITNWFSNRAKGKSAVSKSLQGPRDQFNNEDGNTSIKRNNKRGFRSRESRIRRIERRTIRLIESRRVYRGFRETIPKGEWQLAHTTPRHEWASKAGGTDSTHIETRHKSSWKSHWY